MRKSLQVRDRHDAQRRARLMRSSRRRIAEIRDGIRAVRRELSFKSGRGWYDFPAIDRKAVQIADRYDLPPTARKKAGLLRETEARTLPVMQPLFVPPPPRSRRMSLLDYFIPQPIWNIFGFRG